MKHVSVLLNQSIAGLAIKADGIYVDGTLGRGGHSAEILKRCRNGHLYAFDRDLTAIEESDARLSAISDRYTLIHANFSSMRDALAHDQVYQADGIILDLGVSSPQFDEAQRGFSYRFDAPLDMRMDQSQTLDAQTIVNTWEYEKLVAIFYRYGEEKYAKQIARNIEKSRMQSPITTTSKLVEIIRQSLPERELHKKGHPAKKVFQAIRIAVNDELSELQTALEEGLSLLAPKGRFCVISFHSLEDRMVKEAFAKASKPAYIDKRIPLLPQDMPQPKYRLITRKPILADEEEIKENHRSHCAKLRIIERI